MDRIYFAADNSLRQPRFQISGDHIHSTLHTHYIKHTKIQIYSAALKGVDCLTIVFYTGSHVMHKAWIFICGRSFIDPKMIL